MSDHAILRTSEFDKRVRTYWILMPVIVMTLTVVLIPVIPFVFIITYFLIDKYLERLECTLTERTLEIKKGIFNRVESTIPLEKITDLQMYQGPIMRMFELHGFRVETAGQSGGTGGALVNMLGIVDTPTFRRAVLEQRDRQTSAPGAAAPTQVVSAAPDASADVITDIRDTLLRIEKKLDQSS